ncbi:MAG: hypothetical protein M3R27_10965 [Bacteroidota bacterium]|nr:hypothetical protein [Bacteroidota bacterium]
MVKGIFPLLIFLVFHLNTQNCHAKTTAYTIEFSGIKVGNLYTNVQTVNGITIYQLSSLVDFWMVVKVKIAYKIVVKFDATKMLESQVNSLANGNSYHSTIIWNEDHYNMDCHTYKYDYTATRTEPIKSSLLQLYFIKPESDCLMLSENYGKDASVKKIAEDVYQVETQGNKNKYHYKNGILVMAEMHSPVKNYLIKIVE